MKELSIISDNKNLYLSYLMKTIKNNGDAEDIFQNCLIKFWQSIKKGQYKNDGKPGAYFGTIIHNESVSYFRKKSVRMESINIEVINRKGVTNPQNLYDLNHLTNVVNSFLNKVKKPIERKVFRLRVEGMRFDDIGKKLNITSAAARVIMWRMRKTFATKYKQAA